MADRAIFRILGGTIYFPDKQEALDTLWDMSKEVFGDLYESQSREGLMMLVELSRINPKLFTQVAQKSGAKFYQAAVDVVLRAKGES